MSEPWWGDQHLEVDQTVSWRLGPVRLWILRRDREWRVATARMIDGLSTASTREVDVDFPSEQAGVEFVRFGMQRTTPLLRLRPVLAPLPVVCRPELPFVVHPGLKADALVSTPLWIRLGIEQVPILHEIDLHLSSRTWFGPDTTRGELCLASRTKLRLNAAEFIHDPTRAATRVRINHMGPVPLRVAQIKVPVPNLSLGATAGGTLWTEDLNFGSTEDGLVAAQVGGLPKEVVQPLLLGPRVSSEGLLLHRAVAQFFG